MTLRDEYDEVYRSLSRVDLQKGTDFDHLTLPDLFGDSDERLWLGYYTREGLRFALEKYGLWDALADLGYVDVRMELRADGPHEHLLRIWSDEPEIREAPLLELVARRDALRPQGELLERLAGDYIGVLDIEWLALQRPDAEFEASRPPLPGQHYPGLGLGREILELLRLAAKRLGLEALVTVPSYLHNAYFYSVEFQYLDPREQGTFLALCRDVLPGASGSVAAASWAATLGMVVREGTETPFEWFHDVMVAPISRRLREYVNADTYRREVREALAETGFKVFDRALYRQLESRGIIPLDNERIRTWIGDRV